MRLAACVTAIAAAAAAASSTYQRIAEARDLRRFPPPGRLIPVGPGRHHMVAAGRGRPAVVIIPALADNVLGWLPVLEGVANTAEAVVYDRAEVGWSDAPRHRKRTLHRMALDLQTMLHGAGIRPPYILVGHSIGGIIARRFYALCPREVAGIVLIDSSHEQQAQRIGATDWRMVTSRYYLEAARRQARILGARRAAAQLGLLRGFGAMIDREAPPGHRDAQRAIVLSTRQRHAAVQEMLMFARGMGSPPPLGSVPLTVLTRAPDSKGYWPVWAELQAEMAALSTDSVHVHAETGGHYLHLDEPDLVVRVISDLARRLA